MLEPARDTRMGRRERERRQRRKAILDAARAVFAREGYHNATMARIAGQAEFGVGTLYHFFPNKQELFAEVIVCGVNDHMAELQDELARSATWQARLHSFVSCKIDWLHRHSDIQRLILETLYTPLPDITARMFEWYRQVHEENLQILEAIFAAGDRGGAAAAPDCMAILVMGMLNAVASEWNLGLLPREPSEYIQEMMDLILGGMGDE